MPRRGGRDSGEHAEGGGPETGTHRILFNLISMHKHQVWRLNSSLTSTLATSNPTELKKQAKSPVVPPHPSLESAVVHPTARVPGTGCDRAFSLPRGGGGRALFLLLKAVTARSEDQDGYGSPDLKDSQCSGLSSLSSTADDNVSFPVPGRVSGKRAARGR